jgi:hypothetical protein
MDSGKINIPRELKYNILKWVSLPKIVSMASKISEDWNSLSHGVLCKKRKEYFSMNDKIYLKYKNKFWENTKIRNCYNYYCNDSSILEELIIESLEKNEKINISLRYMDQDISYLFKEDFQASKYITNLKVIDCFGFGLYPKLENLRELYIKGSFDFESLKNCDKLETLTINSSIKSINLQEIPSLNKLILRNCHNQKFSISKNIRTLHIIDCSIKLDCNKKNEYQYPGIQELVIIRNDIIETLPILVNLHTLKIVECPKFMNLGPGPFYNWVGIHWDGIDIECSQDWFKKKIESNKDDRLNLSFLGYVNSWKNNKYNDSKGSIEPSEKPSIISQIKNKLSQYL